MGEVGGSSSRLYMVHITVASSKPVHFIFWCLPFIRGCELLHLLLSFSCLFVQITRVIFCVFLETDFVIYKRKMSLLFQGMCVYSKLTGPRVINPASLHLIYYPLICWGELANELMNT